MQTSLIEFNELVSRLEKMFGKLDEDQREIYYEEIRGFKYFDLKGAVEILINSHPFKRFPLVVEINRAVVLARVKEKRDGIDGPVDDYCPKCENDGRTLEQETNKGRFCSCFRGKKLLEGWSHYIEHGEPRGTRSHRKEMEYPGDK